MVKLIKLKDSYQLDELPEPCETSVDVQEAEEFNDKTALSDEQVFALFKFLRRNGYGEIFTQVDCDQPECMYDRGIRFVNRTGVYAFVFGNTDNKAYDKREEKIKKRTNKMMRRVR